VGGVGSPARKPASALSHAASDADVDVRSHTGISVGLFGVVSRGLHSGQVLSPY
jgi:hypothetical protein